MRSAQDYWAIIVGMGVITLSIRLSMILLLHRTRMTPSVMRGFRFVPPAVFSALIAPALVRPSGSIDLSPGNPYLLAGGLAAVVAWRSKSMLLTIASGMGALLLLLH